FGLIPAKFKRFGVQLQKVQGGCSVNKMPDDHSHVFRILQILFGDKKKKAPSSLSKYHCVSERLYGSWS
ncbi:MAG: hypothetical protein WC988_03395, partial [Patescibacteria group bacterium]